jgi:sulfane dehydrogenase subunit SoxC
MTPNDFRKLALSLEGVEESAHMGAADFRVGGRIFATLAHEAQGYGNLMLDPETQAGFLADAPELFLPASGGWGRMGVTHIRLRIAKKDQLLGALRAAYQLRLEKNGKKRNKTSRRLFLAAPGALGLVSCQKEKPPAAAAGLPEGAALSMRPYGERSPFEKTQRGAREATKSPGVGSSRTPHQDLYGTITPSALHFERHHAGVPSINPQEHRLLIHGLVDQPMTFSLEDLKRFPSLTRPFFIECSGNGGGELAGNAAPDASRSHGLVSNSEWTGVRLRTLLEAAKLQAAAKWIIAEGADACRMARSIPVAKTLDDALVVYAQNGEALRPEQGYPLRLLLPGWEGNASIKWLHRLHAAAEPAMTNQETAHYTDLHPTGKASIFTFEMEASSVITRPSGTHKLAGPGFHEISGIAWSGRGKVAKVEVSTDGGKSWQLAALDEPVSSKALTRFRLPWTWDGQATTIQSRCIDETGYVQPTRDEIIEARGPNSNYHYNGIKVWSVKADGSVTNV